MAAQPPATADAGLRIIDDRLCSATGKVIGECHKRHLAVDFRSFLNTINKSVPADLDVHVIMDNYATHSAPRSSAGLLVTLASISCATRR
jgi:hypothetical protein